MVSCLLGDMLRQQRATPDGHTSPWCVCACVHGNTRACSPHELGSVLSRPGPFHGPHVSSSSKGDNHPRLANPPGRKSRLKRKDLEKKKALGRCKGCRLPVVYGNRWAPVGSRVHGGWPGQGWVTKTSGCVASDVLEENVSEA